MTQISLQTEIVYGPVFSRRLGRSFGINLLPKKYKSCSFDCIYCQYGPTIDKTLLPEKDNLPSVEQVLDAVEKALQKPRSLDYLTFSGNGEPTIHPDFIEIVQGVKDIRDRLRPNLKLALLSNASLVMDPSIVDSIALLDVPMMKLDAGDEDTFYPVNRPVETIKLQDIIDGLKEIEALIIQSALIGGEVSNVRGESFQTWIDALLEINPREVHIYSSERPTAEENVVKVDGEKLQRIESEMIDYYGLNTRAFWFDPY